MMRFVIYFKAAMVIGAVLLFAALCNASTTIAVNDPAVVYGLTKMNWIRSGSTSIFTPNPGAGLSVNFTGTSLSTTFDVSPLVGDGVDPTEYPIFKWNIDGGAYTTHQLTSSDSVISMATGLSNTTHSFNLWFIGADESGNTGRWNQIMGPKITSFTVDTGKAFSNAALPSAGLILQFSDSIGEGGKSSGNATLPPSYAQVEEGTITYATYIASSLNMQLVNVSFAGQKLGGGAGVSGVPGLINSYNLIQNGVSRTFETNINSIIIQMGTNQPLVDTDLVTVMENIRTSVGAVAEINVFVPPGQYSASDIISGFNLYTAAHPTDTNVVLNNLGSAGAAIVTANSYDGIHPNAAGQNLLGAAYITGFKYNYYTTATTANITTLHVGWVEPFPAHANREEEDELMAA